MTNWINFFCCTFLYPIDGKSIGIVSDDINIQIVTNYIFQGSGDSFTAYRSCRVTYNRNPRRLGQGQHMILAVTRIRNNNGRAQ